MAYTNIWEPEGLYRVFTGNVSGDEILESNLEFYADVRFKKAEYIINDFTAISGHSIGPVHLQVYASTDEIISREKHIFKIALVASQAPHVALANGYCESMQEKQFEYQVFRTVEDARKWVHQKS